MSSVSIRPESVSSFKPNSDSTTISKNNTQVINNNDKSRATDNDKSKANTTGRDDSFSGTGLESRDTRTETEHIKAEHDEYKAIPTKTKMMAFYMGLIASLGGFLYGYETGSTNNIISMQYFEEKFGTNSDFSTHERALFSGVLSLGTLAGALFAPFFSDRYGRRFLIICSTLTLFNLGSILQMAAYDLSILFAGRFFNGMGVGVISAVIPLYQAETSPKWIRGSVISCYQWSITWGLFISSAISQGTRTFDDARCYRIPVGLQFVWGTLFVLFMWTLPESPRFYIMKDDLDSAILSLAQIRRLKVDNRFLIEEMIEIKAAHDYEKSENDLTTWEFIKGFRKKPSQFKRIITGVFLQSLQQCSGINFIFYFGVDFFVRTGVSKSYLMSFVTYAVNVAFTIPGIILVELSGRRKVLLFGSMGMCVCNFIIAIVGASVKKSVIADKVMLSFVCVFIAIFAATWGPVVWVITGEIFPLGIRQKGVSICAATNWLINFIFAYITPYLIDNSTNKIHLGTNIFFLWGGFNLLGVFLVFFLVYETQGLMLEDIDELFRREKYSWRSEAMNKIILQEQQAQLEKEKNETIEAMRAMEKDDSSSSQKQYTSNEIDDYLHMVAMEQLRHEEQLQQQQQLQQQPAVLRGGDLYRSTTVPSAHSSDLQSESANFHFEGLYD